MSIFTLTIITDILPSEPPVLQNDTIYQIQVGYKLFPISGLLLLLDAPSYFTQWFAIHGAEATLFLDLDPKLFELIYNHLQGYRVQVHDAYEMMNLWLDSFYYGLARLQNILSKLDIHCVIGGTLFKIPRDLLGPGNLPNYFTVHYDQQLQHTFPVIEQSQLVRPAPHCIVHRLAQLFYELLECLRGNFFVVTDDLKRAALLQECRFYQFVELEQQLIKHILPDLFTPHTFGDVGKQLQSIEPPLSEGEKQLQLIDSVPRQPVKALLMQVVLDDNLLQLVLNLKSTIYVGDRLAQGTSDNRQKATDWFI